jgi:hypothetical protein
MEKPRSERSLFNMVETPCISGMAYRLKKVKTGYNYRRVRQRTASFGAHMEI